MENEYKTYNSKGGFLAAYGLGWNIADIMRNQYNLTNREVWRVDLVISGQVILSVEKGELKRALDCNMTDELIEVLLAERDHARAQVDNAVKLLTSIHALLYPAPIKIDDGRTMVFRPKNPDPHEVLQELSDRIRAIPDKIKLPAPPKEDRNEL